MSNEIEQGVTNAMLTKDQVDAIDAIAERAPDDELLSMASAITESVMMVHGMECDFIGLSLNVLRCPDTHRLMAVVITPVDHGSDGEVKPRYQVDPGNLRRADMPAIVLAS